jgi:hypothetical protein
VYPAVDADAIRGRLAAYLSTVSRDDDSTDDDAETPPERRPLRRPERARSQSGEIVERVNKRNMMGGDARHLSGFRAKDTGPLPVCDHDAVPEESEDDVSKPLADLSDEGNRIYASLVRKLKRAENRTLEVQAAVTHQPESKAKQWSRYVAEKAVALVLGAAMTWLYTAYRDARAEMSDQHDRILTLEVRLRAIERRMPPDVLQPGRPGKEP